MGFASSMDKIQLLLNNIVYEGELKQDSHKLDSIRI